MGFVRCGHGHTPRGRICVMGICIILTICDVNDLGEDTCCAECYANKQNTLLARNFAKC